MRVKACLFTKAPATFPVVASARENTRCALPTSKPLHGNPYMQKVLYKVRWQALSSPRTPGARKTKI